METVAYPQNQRQFIRLTQFPLLHKSQAFINKFISSSSHQTRNKTKRAATRQSFFFPFISFKPSKRESAMASARRASWLAAASISAVEALQDQGGLCRWNYTLRSLHQKARKELGSFSQARKAPSSSSSSLMVGSRGVVSKAEQAKRAEESFRKVMYLSCWGPN